MKQAQQGVGLIEVLITVLVLSTALMALAALQTRALQYNSSAYLRSQANIIAYNIMDQIRIGSEAKGAPALPSDAEQQALVAGLPSGATEVSCAGRICTVSISWTEPTQNAAGDDNESTTFSYQTRV